MQLSVKDAATCLGCSPRTVRAMLLDGRLAGYKRGGRWVVPRRNLPLTEDQQRKIEDAVVDLHLAVDEAVPSHIQQQIGGGVAGLRAFARGRAVLDELRRRGSPDAAATALHDGLCALAEGHHQYDARVKIDALTRARALLSRAAAALLLADVGAEPDASARAATVRLAGVIEADVLPPIGGLLRRAESLPERRAS